MTPFKVKLTAEERKIVQKYLSAIGRKSAFMINSRRTPGERTDAAKKAAAARWSRVANDRSKKAAAEAALLQALACGKPDAR